MTKINQKNLPLKLHFKLTKLILILTMFRACAMKKIHILTKSTINLKMKNLKTNLKPMIAKQSFVNFWLKGKRTKQKL